MPRVPRITAEAVHIATAPPSNQRRPGNEVAPSPAQKGGNEVVQKFCVQVRLAGGLSDQDVRAATHTFNGCCRPPLDAAQVDQIVDWTLRNIRSGASGGQSTPSTTADWEDPIPLRERTVPSIRVDRIPGALGTMAAAVAETTETPVEMPALLGLSGVSSCVAKKATLEIETGYSEPLNVYTAPSMESGNRRTAVVTLMTQPIVDWERAEVKRLQPEIRRRANKRKTIEARIEELRKKAARARALLNTSVIEEIADLEGSMPDIPPLPQLWVQDVTPEKLAEVMQPRNERIAVFSDEGGMFDILAGRYSGQPNFDIFLHAHAGSPFRQERISRPAVFLQNPIITIGISPQPDVLQSLSNIPQFRGRGLLARFLYALPTSPLGSRNLTPKPVPAEVANGYRQLMERLLALSPPTDGMGRWQPWKLTLSADAYDRWKQFQRQVETLMKDGAKLQHLRDWASKLPGATARIAGVFHAVVTEFSKTLIISDETMEQAIDLATPLIDHALAAFDLMGRDKTVENARVILAWIRRERPQKFLLRECFRANQSRLKRAHITRTALHLLVEHGYVRPGPQLKVAHRPSEPFEVNPKLLEEAG